MIKGILRITSVRSLKVFLPTIICGLTVSNVTFQGKPVACARDTPVVRQGDSDLRHRTGVDTKGLRTRTQFLILQLHRLFFCAYG